MIHIRPQAEDSEDKSELDAENRVFNDTLKRMLKTPPDPKKEKRPDRSGTPHSKEDSENGGDAE